MLSSKTCCSSTENDKQLDTEGHGFGDDHISVHFLPCAFTNWHVSMPQHVLGQPAHSQEPIDTPDHVGWSHKHHRKNNIVDLGPPRFKAEGQGGVSELELQTGPGKQWQVELRETPAGQS